MRFGSLARAELRTLLVRMVMRGSACLLVGCRPMLSMWASTFSGQNHRFATREAVDLTMRVTACRYSQFEGTGVRHQ